MADHKTRNGIIVTLAVLALGGGAVYFFTRKKSKTKLEKVSAIILSAKTTVSANGNTYAENIAIYMGFGDDYINAWYQALQEGAGIFIDKSQNNVCSTETGKATGKAR